MSLNRKHFLVGFSVFLAFAAAGWAIKNLTHLGREGASFSISKSLVRYRFPLRRPSFSTSDLNSLQQRANFSRSPLLQAELAEAYFRFGKETGDQSAWKKADEYALKSLKLLPFPNSAKLTLAKLADARHEFEAASRWATEFAREKALEPALPILVSSALAAGRLDEALQWADRALVSIPTSPAYLQHALVLLARGREEEARLDFRRALDSEDIGDPEGATRLRALWARYCLERGEWKAATLLLDEALRISPDDGFSLGLVADMALAQERFANAANGYMRAFEKTRQTRYLLRYAQAKEKLGESSVAAQYREKTEILLRQDLEAGQGGHRLELVELLLEKGTEPELQEALALATEELKVRQSAETLGWLARAQWRLKQIPQAVLSIRAALGTGVRSPTLYALAATIEQARGDSRRARWYARYSDSLSRHF